MPAGARSPRRRGRGAAPAALLLAAAGLSALVVAPAPGYDPWSWLRWGRELVGGTLDTVEGPAFKPLPVLVSALLVPLGSLAPAAWVVVARGGALAAVWLAFRVGRDLGRSAWGGALAAVGVGLCAGYAGFAAGGLTEGALTALALGGYEAWRAGRAKAAVACAGACSLLRPEAWPFALLALTVVWRRAPSTRPLIVALAAAVPALWFLPEWAGSGDPWRSGARALVPNPGQPALGDRPFLEALLAALTTPLWPLWAGVALLAARAVGGSRSALRALVPAAVGAAWGVTIAAMAQMGFSGELRYSMPGAALISISGAVGLSTALRPRARPGGLAQIGLAIAVGAFLALAAAPRLADLREGRDAQRHQWTLATDLPRAIEAAGGRRSVLACGRPYVGAYRGPLLAYALDIPRRVVGFRPRAPGVVFGSRLGPDAPVAPLAAPPFVRTGRPHGWVVSRACGVRAP